MCMAWLLLELIYFQHALDLFAVDGEFGWTSQIGENGEPIVLLYQELWPSQRSSLPSELPTVEYD